MSGLRPLPFERAQRLLGVGVRIQRRAERHLRHAPALEAHARALAEGARGPAAAEVAARLARLRERLWASPYYAERLREAGLSPADLGALEDLRHFPTLDRETLGARWLDLPALDPAAPDPELFTAVSSGSTGKAVSVVRSGYDGLHMWAALRFWLGWHGARLPARPRVVLLCTLPGGLEYSARLPHFGRGALHRISTVRPRPLERLRKAAPSVLFTDPAGLHWLLAQPAPPRPALVLTSAQHLPPALRAEAEAALGAPVVNYYATTELGPVAWECRAAPGVFHALHPDVWVEAVGGELAVTRLRDSVLPLLRYLPGDAGAVADGACRCGFVGRSILGFAGRRACHFRTPAGERVDAWALCWLFKDLPLVGFQLTQEAPQRFHLAVDPNLAMDPALLRTRLGYALQRLGFPAPEVAVELRERAERPAKPEPFVSRVP